MDIVAYPFAENLKGRTDGRSGRRSGDEPARIVKRVKPFLHHCRHGVSDRYRRGVPHFIKLVASAPYKQGRMVPQADDIMVHDFPHLIHRLFLHRGIVVKAGRAQREVLPYHYSQAVAFLIQPFLFGKSTSPDSYSIYTQFLICGQQTGIIFSGQIGEIRLYRGPVHSLEEQRSPVDGTDPRIGLGSSPFAREPFHGTETDLHLPSVQHSPIVAKHLQAKVIKRL